MARDGYTEIVTGIIKTHEERVKKLEALNYAIDAYADTIRSSGNMDAMPHKTGYSNPVEERFEKMVDAEDYRDVWQNLVNAVEFACQSVRENYEEGIGNLIVECTLMYITGKCDDAVYRFQAKSDLPMSTLNNARINIINTVVRYLRYK